MDGPFISPLHAAMHILCNVYKSPSQATNPTGHEVHAGDLLDHRLLFQGVLCYAMHSMQYTALAQIKDTFRSQEGIETVIQDWKLRHIYLHT